MNSLEIYYIVNKKLHNYTKFLLTELRFLSIFTYVKTKQEVTNYGKFTPEETQRTMPW